MQHNYIVTVDLGDESDKFLFTKKNNKDQFMKKLKNKGVFSFCTYITNMDDMNYDKYMKKINKHLENDLHEKSKR